MDTADAETTADETATLMAEVASIKASAETMDCKVFFEGTEEARLKWFNEAKDEMDGTREKGVLDELSRDAIRTELGLKAGAWRSDPADFTFEACHVPQARGWHFAH